jgi:hypothetical protein
MMFVLALKNARSGKSTIILRPVVGARISRDLPASMLSPALWLVLVV